MIISPPFLPDRAGSSEEAWLDAAMAQPASRLASTNAPEGSFPLSLKLGWHNGVHIQAPASGGAHLPVRAVADGKVVFVHAPTAPNNDLGHPLNYNPFHADTPTAAWTSDGFVVIEHRTDIGAEGNVSTEVVYYSACMHMASIANCPKTKAPWAVGDAVCRKDALGAPGLIYGHEGQVHFEICCDEANLRRLTRRGPDWVDPLRCRRPLRWPRRQCLRQRLHLSAGRYAYQHKPADQSVACGQWCSWRGCRPRSLLPTRCQPAVGANHLREGRRRSPATTDWVRASAHRAATAGTTTSAASARLPLSRLRRARASSTTCMPCAMTVTVPWMLQPRAASSPSGWYELLRFGRNLGPDPLPANAAHWRKIATPTGRGLGRSQCTGHLQVQRCRLSAGHGMELLRR
jgi:hypothetical protein